MFQFKKFQIRQDQCAFKVGTDAVLLGAWANPEKATRILDIGTGTGVIALMMAQKSDAQITAIDIDAGAAAQARENVDLSTWCSRMEVLQTSLQDFTNTCDTTFDLIVSNPPFFNSAAHAENTSRSVARNTQQLSFEDLTKNGARLLNNDGKFYLVLPTEEAREFKSVAEKNGLVLAELLRVQTRPGAAYEKRHLMCFQKSAYRYTENTLVIENGPRHDYSQAYRELTRDFYLDF